VVFHTDGSGWQTAWWRDPCLLVRHATSHF